MPRLYVFGDESGNLDFSRSQGATRYFLVTTITLDHCAIGAELLDLKRELYWEGLEVKDSLHATEDRQAVRDRVFQLLDQHDFRVDATIIEKAKTLPGIAQEHDRFYRLAWYLHLKHLVPGIVEPDDELFVIAASLGTKSKKKSAYNALQDVAGQVSCPRTYSIASWLAAVDPCLQVADYCCWAIQRKWEQGDERSYRLIADRIRSEFDVFRGGESLYY